MKNLKHSEIFFILEVFKSILKEMMFKTKMKLEYSKNTFYLLISEAI